MKLITSLMLVLTILCPVTIFSKDIYKSGYFEIIDLNTQERFFTKKIKMIDGHMIYFVFECDKNQKCGSAYIDPVDVIVYYNGHYITLN